MPSAIKCFGIKALAALSAGLPVLVNGNSGLGEALKEVPLGSNSVVDSEDPKDWAKEIKRVRQKNREVRLSESRFLHEKYLERYSWEEPCKSLVIKMRKLFVGGRVICNLQLWQHYVSRWKFIRNADVFTDLRKIASEKGYRVSDNLGLGNCMFYALSEQLEIVKRVKIHHFELRRSLVQYLREHPKMVDGTDLFHFVDGHATWGGYLTDMEQNGTWGDHVILWAAANCYQIAIHVISSLPGHSEVIIKPDAPFDQSKRLVLGHVHELHYVSLQPLQGYDQELADFYASLQPSTTGSGRPQSSGSTEVKQEEDSGSAAQKHKFDPIGEPETSGVSSSSKRRKFEVPMKGVISWLVDVKMEPGTVQHLELKKDLLRDVEEIERSVIFRGEVTEKGNVWNLPEAAAYVTFHEGAVPKPLLFTCSVWPPTLRSPPISSDELLVSNVIELLHDGPPELELSGDDKGNVTVALLHSASDLKGYEVVIKQLVDPYDKVWKDLETWHASEIPDVSDWPQLVKATCTLSQCSSFAAIWRLKSFTFTSRTSVAPQFTCVVPDFSDICVEVPLSSVPVDQDFTLTIKVQEFPSNEVEDFGIWCGPVIHISSSQNIVHMEPVTIKVPLTLRESKHDFSELSNEVIRILYLDSEGKPWNASWTDITGQLEGPVTIKGGIVEFKVKHFCRFCVCMLNGSPVLLEDYFLGLSLRPMPQCVHFHTCLCKTTVPDTYGLLLYCYPNFKQAEVEKKLLSYDIPYKGEGKSKEPACVGDEFVVSPSALDFVRESPRNETVVLRFLGNEISEICDEALIVRTDSKIVPTVKFFKDKALQKLLCEVMILKTRPASLVQVPVTVDLDPRFASCSTEVKQEEESGSAAKKLKLVTSVEPETSRVSSANKTRKFKVSDVKKEERDGEDGHKGRKSKETAIQGIKKISFVGKKRAREESDQKAVHPSTPMRDQDRISPHNISEIPAKKPRTQPNKRMSSKDNTGKGTCAQIVNNEKGKASKPRDSKKKVKQGKPTRKELMGLGRDIGNKWRILGGCLEVEEELDSIDHGYKSLTQKGFQMLKYWTQKNGSSATYRVLSGALEDGLLARKDLSEKYCYD